MNKKKILAWILFLSWLGVIFFFSSQNASSSSNLSNGILDTLEKMFNLPFRASFSSVVIRKLAHFTEYLILAILTCNLISKYTKLNQKNYCLIVLFCLFYASSDEFHQTFVAGRSPQILDVLIDFLGSVIGTYAYYGWQKLRKKKNF